MKRTTSGLVATLAVFLAVALVSSGSPGPADSADQYKVLKKEVLGGEGSWDYVTIDADSRRIYIARSSHVMVVDADTLKVVGDLANTPGVHGVAIAPKHKRGFTSNGKDSTSSIFDTDSLKETSRVKVGSGPDFIIYDPATDRAFTFNAGGKDATAIAADTGKVVGSVPLGGRPEGAVPDGKGMVYVNVMDKNEVVAFDAKELKITGRWPIAPGAQPVGLGIDPAKGRLFVSCRNDKMVVLGTADGKVLGSVPIGSGTDACIFDPSTKLAFSSNKDGTLNVVEEQPAGTFKVQETVTTPYGAKTMALDAKTHNIYLVTSDFNKTGKNPASVPNTFTLVVVGK
jgi:DNA-binding beta-propeller fold protein YncE